MRYNHSPVVEQATDISWSIWLARHCVDEDAIQSHLNDLYNEAARRAGYNHNMLSITMPVIDAQLTLEDIRANR